MVEEILKEKRGNIERLRMRRSLLRTILKKKERGRAVIAEIKRKGLKNKVGSVKIIDATETAKKMEKEVLVQYQC